MDRFISHYRLLECLGKGGAGAVYKAEDTRLGRTVALKLLDGPMDGLLDEARAAASISHPNVAAVYDVGEVDGQPFIALEYVAGETLASRLTHGPLELTEALGIAIGALRALAAAHGAGLVHGDVTPSNIAIGANGVVKVLDFGLSRRAREVTGPAGTPGYLAPEQLLTGPVDARSDLFSLGVVLYESIAGTLPFGRQSWRRELFEGEPVPISSLRQDAPLELERIVRRSLERDLSARYASAIEFATDLERLRDSLGTGSEPANVEALRDEPAFRGLLPFQEADRGCFFGRAAETASLVKLVSHADFRFGVLFGESGTGKSSLLRAGLIPALWEAGFAPLYLRPRSDPIEALVAEARRVSGVVRCDGETIGDYLLRLIATLGTPVVVILDQFEEFFVAHKSPAARAPFLDSLAALHEDRKLNVRILVSMRSDSLHWVGSELVDRIHEPLASSRLFHLRAFDEDSATDVLRRSAQRAGLPIEPSLCRHIAADLAIEGSVLPSELQIVGERLQGKRLFSMREYRRAGGKEVLVYSFLEDVIRACGDREAASLVLRSLVSDENARLSLSATDISRRTQREGAVVARLLRLFVEARLIRELQHEQPWRYELVHEYLIDKINRVTGGVFDATHRANRLLRQFSAGYADDPRTRIPLRKLYFIRRHTDRAIGDRERALFRKSLRTGLIRSAAFLLVFAVVGFATAAAFSIRETWDGVRFTDGHTAAVRRAAFSRDGRLLVTGGEDGMVIVWDFARRQRIATLDGHATWVTNLAFAPDDSVLATGGSDGNVCVWSTKDFSLEKLLPGAGSPVGAMGFSPDGKRLVTATAGVQGAIVWRVEDWSIENELPGEFSSWNSIVFLSNEVAVLRTTSWNVRTGKSVASLEEPLVDVTWLATSPDRQRWMGIGPDGVVRFGELADFGQSAAIPAHHDHGRAAAFSPDGQLAASGAEDVVLWNAATATKLCRLQHTSIVWSVAFSPDGKWLVSTHGDGSVLIWDTAERERVANLNEHSAPVRGIAFSPDGSRMVTTSEDGSAIVWGIDDGRKELTLIGHRTRVAGAAFSADGLQVATVDQSANVNLWDSVTGQLLRQWEPPPSRISTNGLLCGDFARWRQNRLVDLRHRQPHRPAGHRSLRTGRHLLLLDRVHAR
ncbi:MAG: protein kinase [Acidobacteria bacterium]|nr:protein kinase [Acidobacteriota bacterium]